MNKIPTPAELADTLKVLSDPTRLAIFDLLMQGVQCNCETGDRLKLPMKLMLLAERHDGRQTHERALEIKFDLRQVVRRRLGIRDDRGNAVARVFPFLGNLTLALTVE